MARFSTVVDVQAPPDVTWRVLTDWQRHSTWVPLTTMSVLTPRPDGVGARFCARTAVGPVGFDDVMEITGWQPPTPTDPGRCDIVKRGRAVRGTVSFRVEAAPGGSRVVWAQGIEVAPVALTRPFGPIVAAVARGAYTRTLRVMAKDAARTAAAEASGRG